MVRDLVDRQFDGKRVVLADALGVSQGTVSRYVNEHVADPDPAILERLEDLGAAVTILDGDEFEELAREVDGLLRLLKDRGQPWEDLKDKYEAICATGRDGGIGHIGIQELAEIERQSGSTVVISPDLYWELTHAWFASEVQQNISRGTPYIYVLPDDQRKLALRLFLLHRNAEPGQVRCYFTHSDLPMTAERTIYNFGAHSGTEAFLIDPGGWRFADEEQCWDTVLAESDRRRLVSSVEVITATQSDFFEECRNEYRTA